MNWSVIVPTILFKMLSPDNGWQLQSQFYRPRSMYNWPGYDGRNPDLPNPDLPNVPNPNVPNTDQPNTDLLNPNIPNPNLPNPDLPKSWSTKDPSVGMIDKSVRAETHAFVRQGCKLS
jgi:hypothetical protein